MSKFDWKKEWLEMPEYVQEKELVDKEYTVRFKTQKDVDDFFGLINQKEPKKLKSIWFPTIVKTKNKLIYI